MKHFPTIFLLFLIIVFGLLLLPVAYAQGSGDLLGRVNSLRRSRGLPEYSLNGQLSAAAQGQAQFMADTGIVSHQQPDGSGPRTRAINAGYPSNRVSENIYMGTNATADTAWTFWLNSPIHYAGMTSPNYAEIGIGIAVGANGSAYVLVFGNPSSIVNTSPNVASAGASASNNGNVAAVVAPPPSFVLGTDEYGNIMHEVQPEDTVSDIAFLYGYSWGDIAGMYALNGMEEGALLEIGSVFLVPPKDGTHTPMPSDEEPDAEETATPEPDDELLVLALNKEEPSPEPSPTRPQVVMLEPAVFSPDMIATSTRPPAISATTTPDSEPETVITPELASVAMVPTADSQTSVPAVLVIILVQVAVLITATVGLIQRLRH